MQRRKMKRTKRRKAVMTLKPTLPIPIVGTATMRKGAILKKTAQNTTGVMRKLTVQIKMPFM